MGGECAAYRLRMRGERIVTMQRSKNKNHTFVTQNPPFCTSKTILLHVKNHTFVMRICNIQKTNTLRTFRKCVRTPTKLVAKHSARRRGRFIVPVSLHHRICVSTLPNTCFCPPFRGGSRICGHDKSAPTAVNGLPLRCKTRCIIRHSAQQCPNIQT